MDQGKGPDDDQVVPTQPSYCDDDEEKEIEEYEQSVEMAFAGEEEKSKSFKDMVDNFVNSRILTNDLMKKIDDLFQGYHFLFDRLDRFLCLRYKKETGIENKYPSNKLDEDYFCDGIKERFKDREPTKWNEFENKLQLWKEKKLSTEDFSSWLIEFLKGHEDLYERLPNFNAADQSLKEEDPDSATTSSSEYLST